MNYGSNAIFNQNPNLINLGLVSVNTTDKLGSVSVPTTRVGRLTSSSNWIQHGHDIEEAKADRVSKTKANRYYILKSDFETMREIQYFERENIFMSRPKRLDNPPLTRPTELPVQSIKGHVTDDPDPYPSFSDSSSKKKERDKKKRRRKYRKDDSPDPSLSNNSNFSDNSDYRRKRRKRKIDWKKDPIKLCTPLMEKLRTTAYKLKIIRFKMDKDLLQHRFYFLIFVESLEIIFSQYIETCEVILDDPKI